MDNPKKLEQFGIICGIIGPLLMGLGMVVSGLGYVGVEGQRYSLSNHFVSELGEVGVSDLAWAFNSALLLGGILTTIFMVVLAYQLKSWLRYPIGLLGVIATVNAALVGIYPMNNLGMHIQVAMTFFNLGMLISFLYSLVFLFGKQHPFPKWLAIPGLVNAGLFSWFLNFPEDSNSGTEFEVGMQGLIQNRPEFMPMAVLEWAVILGIMVWVLLIAVYLFLKRN